MTIPQRVDGRNRSVRFDRHNAALDAGDRNRASHDLTRGLMIRVSIASDPGVTPGDYCIRFDRSDDPRNSVCRVCTHFDACIGEIQKLQLTVEQLRDFFGVVYTLRGYSLGRERAE
jgi:hypothetical protein